MSLEFGFTEESCNTQYAPLGLLLSLYRQQQVLSGLEKVEMAMKKVDFSSADKLEQVLVSILAGCQTLSEVNVKLKGDQPLARSGGWERFADQSMLSITLDGLTRMNLGQLQAVNDQISHSYGETARHDWRGFLWLDYDLSGLPCGQQAQGGTKGYFPVKKTPLGDN
jgi:hypothetical protein